jgi:hypothetical protein
MVHTVSALQNQYLSLHTGSLSKGSRQLLALVGGEGKGFKDFQGAFVNVEKWLIDWLSARSDWGLIVSCKWFGSDTSGL